MLWLDQPNQIERIFDQVRLDLEIQRAVESETRAQVDLEEPWIQVVIQKDIVSEQLVAVVAADIGLLDLILGCLLYAQKALDYDIIDLAPHEADVDSILLEMLLESAEAPFEATVVISCI